jgi:phosphoenolpyruvate synthase/pyruvate phosphate dikinase
MRFAMVYWLPELRPSPTSGAVVTSGGGKGASLARLARAGFPVPPGFHVTTGAYL